MKAIFLTDKAARFSAVFGEHVKKKLFAADFLETEDRLYTAADLPSGDFSDVEAIFSTWGMPVLTEEEIARFFPSLKYLFYAAGTVQAFARPFIARGVRIFSAWQANAIPVIEYAVAQIVLANKGFYRLSAMTRTDYSAAKKELEFYPGNYSPLVGILGYGAIGSAVTSALLGKGFRVMVYAPDFTEADEKRTGAVRASLEKIFTDCPVVSNHMANAAGNKKIIGAHLFSLTPAYATFINTGRGAQVDEDALIGKLTADPTYTAVLDVTSPEPPVQNSPFCTLPNVVLTPHIAGSSGNEVCRMAEYMIAEYGRIVRGEEPLYEVTSEMLGTMA